MGEYQGHKVAVKVLRIYSTSNLDKIVNVSPREGLRKRAMSLLTLYRGSAGRL